jgi:ribosomal protein S1
MKIIDWGKIKEQYPVGEIIDCKIISVNHYGVYADVNSDEVVGYVVPIDFSKKDHSRIDFPEIDSIVRSVIIGHSENERNQIWLSLNSKIIDSSLDFDNLKPNEYFDTIIS